MQTYQEFAATRKDTDPLDTIKAYRDSVSIDLLKSGQYDDALVADIDKRLFAYADGQGLLPADNPEIAYLSRPDDADYRDMQRHVADDGVRSVLTDYLAASGDRVREAYGSDTEGYRTRLDESRAAAAQAVADPAVRNDALKAATLAGDRPFAVLRDAEGNESLFLSPELRQYSGNDEALASLFEANPGLDRTRIGEIRSKLRVPEGYDKPLFDIERQGDFLSAVADAAAKDPVLGSSISSLKEAADKGITGTWAETIGRIDADPGLAALRAEFPDADERKSFLEDYVKRVSAPAVNEEDVDANVMVLSTGERVLPLGVMLNRKMFDRTLAESTNIPDAQKDVIRATRDQQVSALAPDSFRIIAENRSDFTKFLDERKAQGKSNAEILDEWMSDPENYSSARSYLGGIGESLIGAVGGWFMYPAALAGNPAATKALQDLQESTAERKAYAQLFGKNLDWKYELATLIAPVAADITATLATGGAAATVVAAKTSVRSAMRETLRTALSAGTKNLLRNAVTRRAPGASIDEAITIAGRDLANTLTRGATTSAMLGTAFNRSAGSTYVQLLSTLSEQKNPDGTPKYTPEKAREIALNHGLIAGAVTAAVTGGFSFLGRGGVESIYDGLTARQWGRIARNLRNDFDKLAPSVREGLDPTNARTLLDSVIRKSVKPLFLKAGQASLDEAGEEALDQFIGYFNQSIATGEKINPFAAAKEALYAGMLGGMLGGGVVTLNEAVRPADVGRSTEESARRSVLLDTAALAEKGSLPQTAAALRDMAVRGVPVEGAAEAPAPEEGATITPEEGDIEVPAEDMPEAPSPEQVEQYRADRRREIVERFMSRVPGQTWKAGTPDEVIDEYESLTPATDEQDTQGQPRPKETPETPRPETPEEGPPGRGGARGGQAAQTAREIIGEPRQGFDNQFTTPEGATVELLQDGRASFIVPPSIRGQGAGNAAVERVKRYADATGITISLDIEPLGNEPGMTRGQLADWYERRGFAVSGDRMSASYQPAAPQGRATVEGETPEAETLTGDSESVYSSDILGMTYEDVEDLAARKKQLDADNLRKAFGSEERVRRFLELDRKQNSGNRSVADKAYEDLQREFGDLSADQERLVYGIGEEGYTSEDLDGIAREVANAEFFTTDDLKSVAIEAQRAMRRTKPVEMRSVSAGSHVPANAFIDYVRLREAFKRFISEGMSTNDILGAIVNAQPDVAKPSDVSELVSEYIDLFSKSRPESPLTELPEAAVREALEDRTPVEQALASPSPELAVREADLGADLRAEAEQAIPGLDTEGLPDRDILALLSGRQAPGPVIPEAESPVTAELMRYGFQNGLKAFLSNVAKDGPPHQRRVAKLLARFPEPRVTLTHSPKAAFAGAFIPSTRQILVNTAIPGPRGGADTLLHELLHAATYDSLLNPTPDQAVVLRGLERIRRNALKRAQKLGKNDLLYGLGTMDEFMTHFLTSPAFQKEVSTLTPKGERNWIEVILDAIRDLLNGRARTQTERLTDEVVRDMVLFVEGARPGLFGLPRMDQLLMQPVDARLDSRFYELTEDLGDDAEAWKAANPEKYAELERMRADVLKDAGYDSPKMFRKETSDFDIYDPKRKRRSGSERGIIWWTDNQKTAEAYSGEFLRSAYLKYENPLEINAYHAVKDKSWSDYVKWAKEDGNDAVILRMVMDVPADVLKTLRDNELESDVIGVFSPNQIKSAEPILRDDNGDLIPPSRWGDEESPDIRFQPAGQSPVTPEQDVEYLSAVERGDMETAQRMVDEAAKDAGLKGPYLHGTPSPSMSGAFRTGERDPGWFGAGAYLTRYESYAKRWGQNAHRFFIPEGSYAEISVRNNYRDIRYDAPSQIAHEDAGGDAAQIENEEEYASRFRDSLVRQGFSGVMVSIDGNPEVEVVVFRPEFVKSADPVTYDNDGNVIPLSQRFNPESADIRFQFAGENANVPQFMQDSLETARAMAAAGKSSEEIRAVTGWFPGKYDGKMRWEIPDSNADLVTREFINLDDRAPTKLGDLLDHPALFEAYPELSDINVVADRDFRTSGGSFNPHSNTIVLGRNNGASEKSLSTLLHEIQHAIQKIEGFAKGGNEISITRIDSDTLIKRAQEFSPRVEDYLNRRSEVESSMEESLGIIQILSPQERDEINRLGAKYSEGYDDESEESLKDRWGELGKQVIVFDSVEEVESVAKDVLKKTSDIRRAFESFRNDPTRTTALDLDVALMNDFGAPKLYRSVYLSVAGEIEARDVQARAKLTPEQLRAVAPYSSENIAPEAAIVLYQRAQPEPAEQPPTDIRALAESFNDTGDPVDLDYDEIARMTEGLDPVNTEAVVRSEVNRSLAHRAGLAVLADVTPEEAYRLLSVYQRATSGSTLRSDIAFYRTNPTSLERLRRYLSAALNRMWERLKLRFDHRTSVYVERLTRALAKAERGYRVGGEVKPFDPVADDVMMQPAEQGPVTPEQGAAYLAAVERGDMETAQRMVDEAAKAAGFNVGPVYHGTKSPTFSVFDSKRTQISPRGASSALGFFFSPEKDAAAFYGSVGAFYLRLVNGVELTDSQKHRSTNSRADALGVRRELEAQGYDGITDRGYESIVFDPSQIKSADPVTYDNDGNVIPLSQRFNPESPDIRFQPPAERVSKVGYLRAHEGSHVLQVKGTDKPFVSEEGLRGFFQRIIHVATTKNDLIDPMAEAATINAHLNTAVQNHARKLGGLWEKAVTGITDERAMEILPYIEAALGSTAPLLTNAEADRINSEVQSRLEASASRRDARIAEIEDQFRKKNIGASERDASILAAREISAAEDNAAFDYERDEKIRSEIAEASERRRLRDLAQSWLDANEAEVGRYTRELRDTITDAQVMLKDLLGEDHPMHAVIDRSQGIYLVRSFAVHQNPELIDSVLNDAAYEPQLNALRAFFEDQLVERTVERLRRRPGLANATDAELEAMAAEERVDTELRRLRRRGEHDSADDDTLREVARLNVAEQAQTMVEDFLLGHKAGTSVTGTDSDIKRNVHRFMHKRNLDPAILDALLEIKDPVFNAANTFVQVAGLVRQEQILRILAKQGTDAGLFVSKDAVEADPRKYHGWKPLVSASNSRAWAPLATLHAEPHVVEAFQSVFHTGTKDASMTADKMGENALRFIRSVAGASLGVTTLGNPGYYTRNVVGNLIMLARQGYFPDADLARSFRASWNSAFSRLTDDAEFDSFVNEMTALGILSNGAHIQYVRELIRTSVDNPSGAMAAVESLVARGSQRTAEAMSKAKDVLKAGYEMAANFSQVTEEFSTLFAMMKNIEMLTEAGYGTTRQIYQEAARRTKLTMPSKSEASQSVAAFTKHPVSALLAPFLRFKTEIFRTYVNTYRQAVEDIRSDNEVIRRHGRRTLASAMTVDAVVTVAMPFILAAMSGIGDDEDRLIRAAMPAYDKNTNFWFVRGTDGKLYSYNLSYVNPGSLLGDPFVSMLRSSLRGDVQEIPEIGWRVISSEVFGENIVAGKVNDVRRNKNESTGLPIWQETDDWHARVTKSVEHIGSSFVPAVVRNTDRMIDAMYRPGKEDEPFLYTPLGVLIGQFLPTKARPLNPEDLGYRAFSSAAAANRQLWQITAPLKNPMGYNPTDVDDVYDDLQRANYKIQRDIHRYIEGMKGLGVPMRRIAAKASGQHEGAGISRERFGMAVRGEGRRKVLDSGTLDKIGKINPAIVEAWKERQKEYPEIFSVK